MDEVACSGIYHSDIRDFSMSLPWTRTKWREIAELMSGLMFKFDITKGR